MILNTNLTTKLEELIPFYFEEIFGIGRIDGLTPTI